MMKLTTPWHGGWFDRILIGRMLRGAGFGGFPLLLAGCAIMAGAAAVALLTGFFVGAIQSTFAATARSYGYTDAGNVEFVFSQPQAGRTTFLGFGGRLPGFHFVIIRANPGKAMVAAQDQEEVFFETDVDIDFSVSPPTITGMISEADSTKEGVDLETLYRVTSIVPSLTDPDKGGNRTLVITIVADSLADGGVLEYTLTLQTDLNSAGTRLTGSVEVHRELVIEGEDPIVIESVSGSFEADSEAGEVPDNANEADENENAEENENAGEPANENAEDEVNANEEEPGDEANANEDESLPDEPSGCIAYPSGTDQQIVDAIDGLLALGRDALDFDGDGSATSVEVQQGIDSALLIFGLTFELSQDEAQCVADVLNG